MRQFEAVSVAIFDDAVVLHSCHEQLSNRNRGLESDSNMLNVLSSAEAAHCDALATKQQPVNTAKRSFFNLCHSDQLMSESQVVGTCSVKSV